MGLDVSHDCWRGAYSGFHRWRTRIAQVAGYGDEWPDALLIDDDEESSEVCQGRWKKLPDDPIMILLCHSDCDGQISPEHAGPLADRLEQLLPNLRGDGVGHVGDYNKTTKRFIAGLRAAAEAKENVEFS